MPYRDTCGKCGASRVDQQLGLEPTLAEYIEKMTAIFREVRRVLRADGTCWVNLGDSYMAGQGGRQSAAGLMPLGNKRIDNAPWNGQRGDTSKVLTARGGGLKPKDLCGVPWRLAFALQDDGWWLRSDIIWHKPNPLPESVTDRPTKAHEYLFLLTKSAKYFYDAEAIKEGYAEATLPEIGAHYDGRSLAGYEEAGAQDPSDTKRRIIQSLSRNGGRNRRTVWTVPTQAYPEAHFATFPEALVRPCIQAGTSERGACAKCGKPWERVTEYKANYGRREVAHCPNNADSKVDSSEWRPTTVKQLGWKPACACEADTRPCIALDLFNGAGTTGLVALKAGRHYVGIDLNPEYLDMTIKRLEPILAQGVLL